jgi:hypothetical protein
MTINFVSHCLEKSLNTSIETLYHMNISNLILRIICLIKQYNKYNILSAMVHAEITIYDIVKSKRVAYLGPRTFF